MLPSAHDRSGQHRGPALPQPLTARLLPALRSVGSPAARRDDCRRPQLAPATAAGALLDVRLAGTVAGASASADACRISWVDPDFRQVTRECAPPPTIQVRRPCVAILRARSRREPSTGEPGTRGPLGAIGLGRACADGALCRRRVQLDGIAYELNTRPRKSLGWKCPPELFMSESFDYAACYKATVALPT